MINPKLDFVEFLERNYSANLLKIRMMKL